LTISLVKLANTTTSRTWTGKSWCIFRWTTFHNKWNVLLIS